MVRYSFSSKQQRQLHRLRDEKPLLGTRSSTDSSSVSSNSPPEKKGGATSGSGFRRMLGGNVTAKRADVSSESRSQLENGRDAGSGFFFGENKEYELADFNNNVRNSATTSKKRSEESEDDNTAVLSGSDSASTAALQEQQASQQKQHKEMRGKRAQKKNDKRLSKVLCYRLGVKKTKKQQKALRQTESQQESMQQQSLLINPSPQTVPSPRAVLADLEQTAHAVERRRSKLSAASAMSKKKSANKEKCTSRVTATAQPAQKNTFSSSSSSSTAGDRSYSSISKDPVQQPVILKTKTNATTVENEKLKTRSLLMRPFGRQSLPVAIGRKWVVGVSSAEWDADEHIWKYRILVQRRVKSQPQTALATSASASSDERMTNMSTLSGQPRSMTVAFAWRSLRDFLWLERALRREFSGALLVPVLTIALGRPDEPNMSGMPVEAGTLRLWLTDILNGVRGAGEWLLEHNHDFDASNNTKSDGIGKEENGLSIGNRDGDYRSINILQSESMEAFLYCNNVKHLDEKLLNTTDPTSALYLPPRLGLSFAETASRTAATSCNAASNTFSCSSTTANGPSSFRRQQVQFGQGETEGSSFLEALLSTPLAALVSLELCVGEVGQECAGSGEQDTRNGCDSNDEDSFTEQYSQEDDDVREIKSNIKKIRAGLGDHMLTCTSRALGTAPSLEVMDSFADGSIIGVSTGTAGHSTLQSGCYTGNTIPVKKHYSYNRQLLESCSHLVMNYRHSALSAVERLAVVEEKEEWLGAEWRKFALALTDLFCYEKDIEGKTKIMPYRKLQKKPVEEGLAYMVRTLHDRTVPSLQNLSAMLTAYVADLSAIEPAVEAYQLAMQRMEGLIKEEKEKARKKASTKASMHNGDNNVAAFTGLNVGWEKRLRELTSSAVDNFTSKTSHPSTDYHNKSGQGIQSTPAALAMTDNSYFRDRLQTNEKMLRKSLTTACRSTHVKMARMAWRYWATEAQQSAAHRTAAVQLRTRTSIAHKESINKMVEQHLKQEQQDLTLEMDLVQRMVLLGDHKKFPSQLSAQSLASLRDILLQTARERVGKWDAELALSVMKAVGISNPTVRVEETTRDLRLVRKYAIDLRELLDQCNETCQVLQTALAPSDGPLKTTVADSHKSLQQARKEFLAEWSKVLSASHVPSAAGLPLPNKELLSKAGIDTMDPFGWSFAYKKEPKSKMRHSNQKHKMGAFALRYVESRNAQAHSLLTSISTLLEDYYERVECMESFVYMECVGIQLERHFNTVRTKQLALFERKTDLTAALNAAKRKRMTKVVEELEAKLDKVGRAVSHTAVKETKEAHLESKQIKQGLHDLACRRLTRLRERSTEQAIAVMQLWAKEEEAAATSDLKMLGEAMTALEAAVDVNIKDPE